MKKLYTTSKFKKFNSTRAKKRLRNRIKRKGKGYDPNRTAFGRRQEKKKQIKNIPAPEEFSLIGNTEATLEYFKLAKSELTKGYPINFDISHIKTLTPDAIILQIARIKDENFHFNNGILGNAPENPKLKELFLQSGFYQYVKTRGPKPIGKDKLIHKITDNKVEPQIAKEACITGLNHTFGNEEIFDPLFDILIELMQNTNNHAGETRGKYDWWLHIYNDPNSQTSKYTFLDLGIGIFESIPVKSFIRKVGSVLGISSNVDLVKPLFEGKIKSRTARPERGKGIPQVFNESQNNHFKKFYLISNDIKVNLKNVQITKIK